MNHQLLLAVDTWVVAELYNGIPNWKENFVTNISFPAPKARILEEHIWSNVGSKWYSEFNSGSKPIIFCKFGL